MTLGPEAGQGGRNQELALAAALKIAGGRNIVIASIGTDGSDGSTDFAGGIVDNQTLARAKAGGVDLFESLKTHDSSTALTKLGDTIQTNDTETNVMDLVVLYVG